MSGRKERLSWPDLAKGIGIFLMTLGHSALVDRDVVAWIYTFHMPLFFFISGYFFTLKDGSPWKTIRHKAFPILMPMVTYSLCRWVLAAIGAVNAGNLPDFRPLAGIVLQWPGTPYAGYVWFFAGLFSAEVFFALLLHWMEQHPCWLLFVCFGLAGATWAGSLADLPRLPWHIDAACLLLPYLCLGWLTRRSQDWLEQRLAGKGRAILAIAVLFALQVLSMLVNLRCGSTRIDYNLRLLNEYFTAYLSAVCGIGWFWLLCRKLPAPRCLTFVGEYSSVYYCVGWLGSNLAHRLVTPILPVHGLALLAVHLLGMWLGPVPLILILDRVCPEAMGKRRKKSERTPEKVA